MAKGWLRTLVVVAALLVSAPARADAPDWNTSWTKAGGCAGGTTFEVNAPGTGVPATAGRVTEAFFCLAASTSSNLLRVNAAKARFSFNADVAQGPGLGDAVVTIFQCEPPPADQTSNDTSLCQQLEWDQDGDGTLDNGQLTGDCNDVGFQRCSVDLDRGTYYVNVVTPEAGVEDAVVRVEVLR